MELLAERYIGICEENGMFFNNYKNACKEEALKEIIKGDNPYFKPFEKPPKGFYKLKKLELITLILKA